MKGECPENKKEKHKKIHRFKKPKAMVATWSDEDSSEKEEEEKSSTSESEEICFMANSSDGKTIIVNRSSGSFRRQSSGAELMRWAIPAEARWRPRLEAHGLLKQGAEELKGWALCAVLALVWAGPDGGVRWRQKELKPRWWLCAG
ncbi:hypothetical protein Taro_047555, partial [Colocasia esculenta]|nr:hypothetical protein [Colocasia esculenta]